MTERGKCIMRKKRLSKTVALITAVGLAASSVNVAYAGSGTSTNTGSKDTGKGTTEGGQTGSGEGQTGSTSQESKKVVAENVSVTGKQTDNKVIDGSVSNDAAKIGVDMQDGDAENKLDATVIVKGDVSVSNKNEESNGYYSEVDGVSIDSNGGKGNVEISGSVKVDATHQSTEYGTYAEGVYTNSDSTIKIGGNVEAISKDGSNGIHYTYPYTENSPDYTVNTEVKGNIAASTSDDFGNANGLNIQDNSTDKTIVGGNITAEGDYATGIKIANPAHTDFGKDKSTEITVDGKIEANGTKQGIGIEIDNNLKTVDITVKGDISGSMNGILINDNKSDNVSIKTEGTISSEKGAAILVMDTTNSQQDEQLENDVDSKIPDISVWKIETNSKDLVRAQVYDSNAGATDETKSEELKNKVLSSINYIIKAGVTEDGQDTENGKIELTGTSGTVTIGENTYDTAHQGDKITISVKTVNGYKYSLSNGEAMLTANDDGTYTLEIPAGGGVDLKAVLEKIQEQEEDKEQDKDQSDDTSKDQGDDANKGQDNNYDQTTNKKHSHSIVRSSSSNSSLTGDTNNSGTNKWNQDSIGWKVKKADGSYANSEWYEMEWNGSIDWYHFDGLGYAQGGWYTDTDGQKYYLYNIHDGQFGYMYTGWKQIDGVWYYFNTTTADGHSKGSMLVNSTTADGYTVGADGTWVK